MTALSGHEPQIKISIPAAASRLLGALRRAGFEAYAVGGCVRDSLLGRTPGEGLIDLYGGRSDLHACLMRCVGNPEERFAEDALRILRAVRLAAQLDFALEKATERAALDMRQSIHNISAERIYT